jgi:hypothetical protein
MLNFLLENYIRKRTRLSKDQSFIRDIYNQFSDAFDEELNAEEFVDKIAELYDPTYELTSPEHKGIYIDYIIDNLKRNVIQFDQASQQKTRRILKQYNEDQTGGSPMLSKDLQRAYRNITPDLENAAKDLENYNKQEVISSPEFETFYRQESSGAFGGQNQSAFFEVLARLFDPSPDQRYMRYIVYNLTPHDYIATVKEGKKEQRTRTPSITKEDGPFVKSLLTAHMEQVNLGNTKIKRDVMRFYRDIRPMLVDVIKPYIPVYNTTTEISQSLELTKEFFKEKIGDPIYTNNSNLYYLLQDVSDAKKVIQVKTSQEFATVQRHCTGYWCLPTISSYFPSWISLDVYGFVDYAVVPKPQSGFVSGEIKNRLNNAGQGAPIFKANATDYESLLDFMLNSPVSNIVATPFKKLDISETFSSSYANDYAIFLARSPDIETVNALANKNYADANDYLRDVFNITPATTKDLMSYQAYVLPKYIMFQRIFSKMPDNYPLFEQFKGKAEGVTTGTILDYSQLATGLFDDWKNKLQAFVNAFLKDANASLLDANNLKAFASSFSYANANTIKTLFPEKFNKVCSALTKKVQDSTIRFEGASTYGRVRVFLADVLSETTNYINKDLRDALSASFADYLKTGGLQMMQWKADEGGDEQVLEKLAELVKSNVSDKAKVNIIGIYMQMLDDVLDNEAHQRSSNAIAARANAILESMKRSAGYFAVDQSSIALAVAKSLEKQIANNVPLSDALFQAIYKTFADVYVAKIKAINAQAPNFVQRIAVCFPKSSRRPPNTAALLYPNAVNISNVYVSVVLRNKDLTSFLKTPLEYKDAEDIQVRSGNQTWDINHGAVGMHYFFYKQNPSWSAIEHLLSLAASDNRDASKASFAQQYLVVVRDCLNKLVSTFDAKPIGLYFRPFSYLARNANQILSEYKQNRSKFDQFAFIITLKLNNDKIVAISDRGRVMHVSPAGTLRISTYDDFADDQVQAENRTLKIKNFNVLFERVNSYNKLIDAR